MSTCPRCSEPAAQGQEYCLVCGARLTLPNAGANERVGSEWWLRALLAGAVALAGGVAAVAATGGNDAHQDLTTAVGGFVTTPGSSTLPSPSDGGASIADWPSGTDGWTIVLASYPQTEGRRPADLRAKQARAKGLPQVGVLDSSSYASLHPGYWVVFSGIYTSEAEATSALEVARKASRTAAVRHVVT